MNRFFNNVAESLSSTWRLLSDTTNFLSRARLLAQYEQELKRWRDRLYSNRNNPETAREVREQVVALRRLLRSQGYDLRLGSKDIALEGFKHDDAMVDGFRRLVIGIAEDDIYAIAGDYNHIELANYLDQRLRAKRNFHPYQLHCLWYRWRSQVLVLAGADSETSQQFEELKSYFAANREFLLKKLGNL